MTRRQRDNRSFRSSSSKPPIPRVLIYCGGACTEPDYFDGLRRSLDKHEVILEVRHRGDVSPDKLVNIAKGFAARSSREYDEIWCVVDVDNFDIGRAAESAQRQGVRLAVSHPCFEFWLLLHH